MPIFGLQLQGASGTEPPPHLARKIETAPCSLPCSIPKGPKIDKFKIALRHGNSQARLKCLDDQKHTQNPEFRQKTRRLHELFRKVRVNSCLLPVTRVRNPTEFVQKKLVQTNYFILGGFLGVDFPPVNFSSEPPAKLHLVWGNYEGRD